MNLWTRKFIDERPKQAPSLIDARTVKVIDYEFECVKCIQFQNSYGKTFDVDGHAIDIDIWKGITIRLDKYFRFFHA